MLRLVVGLLLVAASTAFAQVPSAQQELSVEDLVRALTPPQASSTRSLRNLKVEPAKVDLVINFDFNSARILESSRPQLERLATVMKLEQMRTLRFQVEGHTDAKGTAQYNQTLSEKRAAAVVNFLTQEGVAGVRLDSVGRGFNELLNKDDPTAAANRRVRIVTLVQ
jgi:outer membrane protein OmpA-like peptidoglycan-associated protein